MTHPQRSIPARLFALVALAAAAAPAQAHSDHGALAGFAQAAMHPLTGIDHVLAAVAAGMVASHIGGRGGIAVLFAFLGGLLAGVVSGWAGPSWLVEGMLGASVVAMATLLLARSASAIAQAAVAAAALFAVFHGLAHRSEAGSDAALAVTAAGFALSTAMLLLAGFGLQRALAHLGLRRRAADSAHLLFLIARNS